MLMFQNQTLIRLRPKLNENDIFSENPSPIKD